VEPEQRARQEIDRQLGACGWIVQGHKAMNLAAGPGIAAREFPLDTGTDFSCRQSVNGSKR
jgi:type I restriction enzyme R subunit